MKGRSVSLLHCYLLGGIFLVVQFFAVAHLSVHTLEKLQASYELSDSEPTHPLELCGVCIAAEFLDSSTLESAPQYPLFSSVPFTINQVVNGLVAPSFSLYLARAPPAFS